MVRTALRTISPGVANPSDDVGSLPRYVGQRFSNTYREPFTAASAEAILVVIGLLLAHGEMFVYLCPVDFMQAAENSQSSSFATLG
jgi:hypothetical protein